MFIEFQTKDDKAISYNVENVVFVGEMKDKVSVLLSDGTHLLLSDEYVFVVKDLIEKTKSLIDLSVYVQFETKKEERIAFPIRRVFYILEQEETSAIMFNDGTRIEILGEYADVMERIRRKIDFGVIRPTAE